MPARLLPRLRLRFLPRLILGMLVMMGVAASAQPADDARPQGPDARGPQQRGPGGPGGFGGQPGFGGPGGFGGGMGRDALNPLIASLAELNLAPDFNLTREQKEKIRGVREAFRTEQEKWRTEHEADFKKLQDQTAKLFTSGGPPNPAMFQEIGKAQQELMSTAPDGEEPAKQIKAVLTADQLKQIEGDGPAQRPEGGRPGWWRIFGGGQGANAPAGVALPADGVAKQPGFYKLKFQAQVQTESGAKKVSMAYVLYLPKGYDAAKNLCPTIVFLHGAGEAGTDGSGIFAHGPAMELQQQGGSKITAASFPFILVCPQCPPRGERWDQPVMLKAVLALLDDLAAKVRIDPDRVYVTGLSMGGKGSWLLAMEAPERFAAIAPIAADTLDTRGAERLKYPAVWAIDGAQDWNGGPENNKKMVDTINAAGGDAKVSIVPDQGHFVWPIFYSDPKFYDWFLAHKRLTAEQRRARDAKGSAAH